MFGPDIVALKGKTNRQTPKSVRYDTIEIPPKIREIQKDIFFCFDIMYLNGMPFMNGIDKTIKFHSKEPLSNMQAEKIYQGLDVCLHVYNHDVRTVTEIRCDQNIPNIMDAVHYELCVHMKYTYDVDHEPVADCNNLMFKDHIISIFHSLPFRTTPNIMVGKITTISTKLLIWFTVKGRVSPYYSPYSIIHVSPLDCKKH